MNERTIKTAYHAMLAGVALMELKHAKTPFRKAVVLAWCAFHATLAYTDWTDKEESEVKLAQEVKPTKVIQSPEEVDCLIIDPNDWPQA